MARSTKVSHPLSLDMPDGYDPCGVPCADAFGAPVRRPTNRRSHRHLPGLAATSRIASVEEIVPQETGDWLAWGCVEGRPVLFSLQWGVAAEMMEALAAGESATAIVEPWQLVVERLD